MKTAVKLSAVALVLVMGGCKSGGDDGDDGTASGSGGDDGGGPDDGGSDSGDSGMTSGGDGGATGDGGSGTATGDGGDGAVGCSKGDNLACNNGMDDDGDGLIDAADPECTGPCDDDEGSFETGIPGDNMDCWQDCFFDGNSGHGDDGCRWNLKCDPANPGENVNCEYTGGNNCDSMPADTPDECVDFCTALTPNGCDCFGCCTVALPDGSEKHIFLGSGEDCALDNLDACSECTPQADDCGNPCEPEMCELCFGGTLPEECDEPECPPELIPCTIDPDEGPTCPDGYYCVTGCCVPYNPEG